MLSGSAGRHVAQRPRRGQDAEAGQDVGAAVQLLYLLIIGIVVFLAAFILLGIRAWRRRPGAIRLRELQQYQGSQSRCFSSSPAASAA
jgi:hypothetical protein